MFMQTHVCNYTVCGAAYLLLLSWHNSYIAPRLTPQNNAVYFVFTCTYSFRCNYHSSLREVRSISIWVCLSVCLSGRITQKLLLRLTWFFAQEVLYLWLGPPLKLYNTSAGQTCQVWKSKTGRLVRAPKIAFSVSRLHSEQISSNKIEAQNWYKTHDKLILKARQHINNKVNSTYKY